MEFFLLHRVYITLWGMKNVMILASVYQFCVNFVARMIISYVLTHVMMTKNIQGWIFGMET